MSPSLIANSAQNNNSVSAASIRRDGSPELTISSASLIIPDEERKRLHLTGLIPRGVCNLHLEEELALEQLRSKETPLQKYIYLASMRNTNPDIFYNLVAHNLKETAPIIYTPTVAEKPCQEFPHIYSSIISIDRLRRSLYLPRPGRKH